MKNRMREICTSGTVRGGGGNILTYSDSNWIGVDPRSQSAFTPRKLTELLHRRVQSALCQEETFRAETHLICACYRVTLANSMVVIC